MADHDDQVPLQGAQRPVAVAGDADVSALAALNGDGVGAHVRPSAPDASASRRRLPGAADLLTSLPRGVKVAEGKSLDAAAIREFCAGKISHHKIPRYVVLVGDYPMTVTGKVQKNKLREQFQDHRLPTA